MQQLGGPAQPIQALGSLVGELRRHVFVDNSNIYYGARKFESNGMRINPAIRIDPEDLSRILCKGKEGTHIVAGSKPPDILELWQKWEDSGFTVKICNLDSVTRSENVVDEFLHAQIYREITNRST